jgi:formylglycine-generating enzyme
MRSLRSSVSRALVLLPPLAFAGALAASCGGAQPLPGVSAAGAPASAGIRGSAALAGGAEGEASASAGADAGAGVDGAAGSPGAGPSACPLGMQLVDTTYCPTPVLRCLRSEYDKPNHITICHEFAPGQRCPGELRRQRFCIDTYEYPNQEGAHPPVMVDWYDAAGACAAQGKRLCWESEWVSACEGPDKLPFPYGEKRDPNACNIDNPYVKPSLERVYSSDPAVQGAELLRLDESVASGERKACVSGFGVHDLTGNFDEWVNAESPHDKSKWAGLKGGAWGHVRNACRPMTVSHPPEFTYYFISFRCCADAAPAPASSTAELAPLWTPPPPPRHPDPSGAISPGWTTRERGPNRPRPR